MKRISLLMTLAVAALLSATSFDANAQDLTYRVLYHLGFIEKDIATAHVRLDMTDTGLFGTINGHSIPWGGRLYTVSDTLRATMTPNSSLPYGASESIDYINGWYSKPYSKNVADRSYNPENPANYRNIKGEGSLDASYETMEAVAVTADMIGMYYYFKHMDFASMRPGQSMSIPIAGAGNKGNMVRVTYGGTSSYNAGGGEQPTYNVVFEYSYDGSMCNYPVTCQVSQSTRIPLLLSAQLKIGHVEMILEE